MRTLIGSNLKIEQLSENAFNLDTILLANFVRVQYRTKTIIDVGTGNGSIALYLTQKANAKVIGIEIQEHLAEMAINNVKINDLENSINIVCCDIKKEYKSYKDIDCIVSNPPFFKVNDKTKINEIDEKAISRHEISLNVLELIEASSYMLRTGGRLFIIHRPERLFEIIEHANKNRMSVKRVRFVHPYLNASANHVLIEMHKDGKIELVVEKPLILYKEKHEMTEELQGIYSNNNYKEER